MIPPGVSEPSLYLLTATLAVLLAGFSKASAAGGIGLLAVPLMAMAIAPQQAAAIMLPILCALDLLGLWTYRREVDARLLGRLIPGALAGIVVGALVFKTLDVRWVKGLLGVECLVFALHRIAMRRRHGEAPPAAQHRGRALFWSGVSGFTSTIAHAGGPPYQFYTLPLGKDPKVYVGTSVIFFAIINAVKLVPYFALGQFDATNLATSAILMPIAPVATLAGAWIVRRIDRTVFYPFMYAMIFLVGLKLVYDGVVGLAS